MRKLIIGCQIAVIFLFVVKILFLAEAAYRPSISSTFPWITATQAIAQTTNNVTSSKVKDITEDHLKNERDLFAFLQKKQKDLEARENAIKSQEERMTALKTEIEQKIDALKALEAQLAPLIDDEMKNDEKRIRDLAKVYESAPPEKAAAAIEKLGVKTAAIITINMKRDRAGLILGHLSPEKAVDITNEITRAAGISNP
ncbi:MAG: hypothetical protein JXA41_01230 [Deltaproteobacteria bacterium]|nr:hypothetical protein [Deltaproteobacteria bacterium]